MGMSSDLSAEALAEILPRRPVRCYPAMLSTEADALAWARTDAPAGAVVVADYQVSARGRAGLEWTIEQGISLCFSMILRPRLAPEKEGWLYTVGTSGLADVLGETATIEWPDLVLVGEAQAGAVGVQVSHGPATTEWAVISVLVAQPESPRPALLARIVEAIEARSSSVPPDVLADYLQRCRTLGQRVRARLIPMGPTGPRVTGKAVGSLTDGALVIETDEGKRIAVRPQNLGLLEKDAG